MPSDDAGLSQEQVRHIIREETDAALRYQRKTFFAALSVFLGGQLMLIGIVALGFPLYAIAIGGFVAFFGVSTLVGQRSFAERDESTRADSVSDSGS